MKLDNDRPNSNSTFRFFRESFRITASSPQSQAVNLRALSCCAAKTKIREIRTEPFAPCPLREIFLSFLESFCPGMSVNLNSSKSTVFSLFKMCWREDILSDFSLFVCMCVRVCLCMCLTVQLLTKRENYPKIYLRLMLHISFNCDSYVFRSNLVTSSNTLNLVLYSNVLIFRCCKI